MNWLLVAIIVVSTTIKDVLQAIAMKRHGEIQDTPDSEIGEREVVEVQMRETLW